MRIQFDFLKLNPPHSQPFLASSPYELLLPPFKWKKTPTNLKNVF